MLNCLECRLIPRGPITCTNISNNSCTLSWLSPEPIDGKVSDLTGYYIEQMDIATKKWQFVCRTPTTTAKIQGLVEGHKYSFRLAAETNNGGKGPTLEIDSPVLIRTVPLSTLAIEPTVANDKQIGK